MVSVSLSGLHVLVQLLFDVIPMLGNVFLLWLFFMVMFSVSAVVLWRGAYHYGCYNPDGDLFVPDNPFGYVCGWVGLPSIMHLHRRWHAELPSTAQTLVHTVLAWSPCSLPRSLFIR